MSTARLVLLGYLLVINIVGCVITGRDKEKARRKQWRTPEKAFWTLALFGGGIGVLAGFYAFRHKTKHTALVFTVAVCALLCYVGCFFLWKIL